MKVKELKAFLGTCPDDAEVLLNHYCQIDFEEDNGKVTKHKAWIFDEIIDAQCEVIEDKERYSEWKADDKLVWLTHQVDD